MDTMTTADHAARLLRRAAETGLPIEPLRERVRGLDESLAYAIQDTNTRASLDQGRRLVGRKIGLTSVAVQAQLGVDQPDFGMLFADMAVGDGEAIAVGRLIQPKVEGEIALLLRADLPFERHTYADLIRATECVLPAIEIVDSRIQAWDIGFVDTVADNASAGLYVLGSRPRKLRDVDLVGCAMQMKRGAEVVSTGSGRACLGNPLSAAVWLADVMVKYGRPLRAGDIVLTGALGPMVAARSGDRFEMTVEGLGSVVAQFA